MLPHLLSATMRNLRGVGLRCPPLEQVLTLSIVLLYEVLTSNTVNCLLKMNDYSRIINEIQVVFLMDRQPSFYKSFQKKIFTFRIFHEDDRTYQKCECSSSVVVDTPIDFKWSLLWAYLYDPNSKIVLTMQSIMKVRFKFSKYINII